MILLTNKTEPKQKGQVLDIFLPHIHLVKTFAENHLAALSFLHGRAKLNYRNTWITFSIAKLASANIQF